MTAIPKSHYLLKTHFIELKFYLQNNGTQRCGPCSCVSQITINLISLGLKSSYQRAHSGARGYIPVTVALWPYFWLLSWYFIVGCYFFLQQRTDKIIVIAVRTKHLLLYDNRTRIYFNLLLCQFQVTGTRISTHNIRWN